MIVSFFGKPSNEGKWGKARDSAISMWHSRLMVGHLTKESEIFFLDKNMLTTYKFWLLGKGFR